MSNRTWTPEERDEYDALCQSAWDSSSRQDERTDVYLNGLYDGQQAQRMWARDMLFMAERNGAQSQLKSWNKSRNRVAVSYEGEVLDKPRMIGTTKTDAQGKRYSTQMLFDFMSRDELAQKRTEYIKQVRAYNGNIAAIDALLALMDAAPGALSPSDAAKQLGTTVESWLGAA